MNLSNYLATNRVKLFKTFLCYVSFFCYGASYTLLGSSLFDLQIRLNVLFTAVSRLVPARSFGILIGSVTAGFLGIYLKPEMVLFLSNILAGLLTSPAPWFEQYNYAYACFFVSGIATGIHEIYSNMFVLSIWREKATNYVQVLHGLFGLGSLLAPLIVKSFLLPQMEDSNIIQSTNATESTESNNITESLNPRIVPFTSNDVKVQYPFTIFGLIYVLNSLGFLFSYFKSESVGINKENEIQDNHSGWKKLLTILIGAFICHVSFANNALIGSLAPAFVVRSDLKMTKKDGADLVSTYWTVYTSYRLFFIIVSNYFEKRKILIFNCLISLISSACMFFYAAHNRTFAWISFILFAIGFSPTFAASLGFIQEYFFITEKYASFIFLIGAIGDTVHPWIATGFMDKRADLFATYVSISSAIQSIVVILLPFILVKLFKVKNKEPLNRTSSLRISQR